MEPKPLKDKQGAIAQAYRILPEDLRASFLAALAELEDNACHLNRFPADFMFQLTVMEWETISSQFVMTSRMKLADYNDINEDTRMQLELINQTLAELQSGKRNLPRPKVGYVK